MRIVYTKQALKFLDKLPEKAVERIRKAIAKLTLKPPEGDVALMQGFDDRRMRLRIGSWRIIFKYTAQGEIEILLVMEIGNRGDIYK